MELTNSIFQLKKIRGKLTSKMYQAEDRISGSDGKIFARLKKMKKIKTQKSSM